MTAVSAEKQNSSFDIAAIAICALTWGTTWYAITLQFGVVDPVISIIYRFALAAALLFVIALVTRTPLTLNWTQHRAALGVGFFTFAGNYPLVYWAEERITSAVVAVAFAGHALCNLALFRVALNERAGPGAWAGAGLGAFGVVLASWGELIDADMNQRALIGLVMAALAVVGAAFGNLFARKGQIAGAPIVTSTGWAMAYGAAMLAVFALVTGKPFLFDTRPLYVLSLLHLAVFGSVVAFVIYFTLAKRRGFGVAAYVGALTPLTAMSVSAVFEGKHWGPLAYAGLASVLAGQWLILRTRRA